MTEPSRRVLDLAAVADREIATLPGVRQRSGEIAQSLL